MTTNVQEIVDVMAEVVPDGGTALMRRAPQALAPARAIEAELVPRLEANPAYALLWQQFKTAPEGNKTILVSIVEKVVNVEPALNLKLDNLLSVYHQAVGGVSTTTTIDTGGGVYVGGSVTTGGDFVGRDKIDIVGDGNVIGSGNTVSVSKSDGLSGDTVAALFAQAAALARQKPVVVRDDVEAAVEIAQKAMADGEKADSSLLNKALDVLLDKGPDVLELVLNAILNPAAAAGKGAKMLARQARGALEKKRKAR